MIREYAEVIFSLVISRLLIVDSRRFWNAPSLPRTEDTYLMAPSTRSMASSAPSAVLTSTFSIPIFCKETAGIFTSSTWCSLAPICKRIAPIPVALIFRSWTVVPVCAPFKVPLTSRRISNPFSPVMVKRSSFSSVFSVFASGKPSPNVTSPSSTILPSASFVSGIDFMVYSFTGTSVE